MHIGLETKRRGCRAQVLSGEPCDPGEVWSFRSEFKGSVVGAAAEDLFLEGAERAIRG